MTYDQVMLGSWETYKLDKDVFFKERGTEIYTFCYSPTTDFFYNRSEIGSWAVSPYGLIPKELKRYIYREKT